MLEDVRVKWCQFWVFLGPVISQPGNASQHFSLGRIKKQSCFSSGGFSKFDEGGFFFFFLRVSDPDLPLMKNDAAPKSEEGGDEKQLCFFMRPYMGNLY